MVARYQFVSANYCLPCSNNLVNTCVANLLTKDSNLLLGMSAKISGDATSATTWSGFVSNYLAWIVAAQATCRILVTTKMQTTPWKWVADRWNHPQSAVSWCLQPRWSIHLDREVKEVPSDLIFQTYPASPSFIELFWWSTVSSCKLECGCFACHDTAAWVFQLLHCQSPSCYSSCGPTAPMDWTVAIIHPAGMVSPKTWWCLLTSSQLSWAQQ